MLQRCWRSAGCEDGGWCGQGGHQPEEVREGADLRVLCLLQASGLHSHQQGRGRGESLVVSHSNISKIFILFHFHLFIWCNSTIYGRQTLKLILFFNQISDLVQGLSNGVLMQTKTKQFNIEKQSPASSWPVPGQLQLVVGPPEEGEDGVVGGVVGGVGGLGHGQHQLVSVVSQTETHHGLGGQSGPGMSRNNNILGVGVLGK